MTLSSRGYAPFSLSLRAHPFLPFPEVMTVIIVLSTIPKFRIVCVTFFITSLRYVQLIDMID